MKLKQNLREIIFRKEKVLRMKKCKLPFKKPGDERVKAKNVQYWINKEKLMKKKASIRQRKQSKTFKYASLKTNKTLNNTNQEQRENEVKNTKNEKGHHDISDFW